MDKGGEKTERGTPAPRRVWWEMSKKVHTDSNVQSQFTITQSQWCICIAPLTKYWTAALNT